jgi:hypothetical protein
VFLLPSIAIGLLLAWVLGGRVSRVAEVRLRAGGTVVAALAIQLVLFSRLGGFVPTGWRSGIHLASYALLIGFAAANLRVRALALTLLGMVLNAIAIGANGGRMPLSADAARAAGLHVASDSNVSAAAHRLAFLGDVFALPARLPLANAFSVGDVLIGAGMVGFIVSVSFGATSTRVFDFRRIAAPLEVRDYRLLVSGRLVSHLGDWITLAGLVGWVYTRTGSTANVAVLMLARLAPPVLGGGVAAIVVDRLPKSRLLVGLELARGALVAGALAAVVSGSLAGVLVALACSGALAAMSNAAASSIVPALLTSEQLAAANAALGVAKDVAMAFGALAAGVVFAHVGVAAALGADAGTFAITAALYVGIAPPVRPASSAGQRASAPARTATASRRSPGASPSARPWSAS